jgi:excisionase family DNA binding protein
MNAERELFSFDELADRWGVSQWTIRRCADRGDLKVINIGTRRLIPKSEIMRVEQVGLGTGRRRKVAAR